MQHDAHVRAWRSWPRGSALRNLEQVLARGPRPDESAAEYGNLVHDELELNFRKWSKL